MLRSRNDARAKVGVGLRATPEIQRNPPNRTVSKIQISRLIVPPRVRHVDRCQERVFDFVFIARGGGKIGQHVAGLGVHVRAVVLKLAVSVSRRIPP